MKNIRYYAFWILDFLKGSPFRKHYKEIQKIFYGTNGAKELQQTLLSNILHYATLHTDYYKDVNPEVLNNFPVITKSDIITYMEAMFSKEYKTKREALKIMCTSGSSGTPFKIYQDANKVLRNKADLVFFYNIGGYYIGDRMYYMRIWTEMNKKSKIQLYRDNFRMLDASYLDILGSNKFIKTINSYKKEKVILGYASSFTALMNHLEYENIEDWKIKSIFTQAEELPIKVKRKMRDMFKCPVMSRYSNQENGIIAQQPRTGEDYFELNTGSYFVEFLKLNSDEPADEMEEARIVITDLFNRAIPMIRYDTEDIGIYSYITDKNGRKQKVLNKIIGRRSDYLYSNKKEKLAPQTFSVLMWKYNCIKQYQLIQEDYDIITLKLVYKENKRENNIEEQLIESIKQLFGDRTKINIQNVENIPIAASGKRKYIMSMIDEDGMEFE